MPEASRFAIFLGAAVLLAVTPGPGIFYVLTRSLKGGRLEGIRSAVGTAMGGMFHVLAAALGLSIVLAASALAFNIVKYAGAAYLIYLGIKTLFGKSEQPDTEAYESDQQQALFQGALVEMLNPKTALFFLAFIPQFINPEGTIYLQFVMLGTISVLLNTSADLVVAMLAGSIGHRLQHSPGLRRGQKRFTAAGLVVLGVYVATVGESQ